MFKLVESLSRDPIRFPIKPGVRLVPGHIVKTTEYDGNVVIDLCDGYNAFGIVGNRCWGGSSLDFTKKGKVYLQRMIAHVGKFDRKAEVIQGISLYSNNRGVLTSRAPFDGAIVLAKVISPASEEKKHMEILWL